MTAVLMKGCAGWKEEPQKWATGDSCLQAARAWGPAEKPPVWLSRPLESEMPIWLGQLPR